MYVSVTCVSACVCVDLDLCVAIYVCTFVHVFVCIYVDMCTFVCVYVCMYVLTVDTFEQLSLEKHCQIHISVDFRQAVLCCGHTT